MAVEARTRKGARGKARLIEAAWPLFYRKGIHATSVDDILTEAEMGKSQFYHYFSNKDALVCEVVDYHIDGILDYLEPHARSVEHIEDLKAWLEAYVELAQMQNCLGCPVGVVAAEMAVENEGVRTRVIQAFERWRESLRSALQRIQESGELVDSFDCDRAAPFIAAAIQGALLLTRAFSDAGQLENAGNELMIYLDAYRRRKPS